MLIARLKHYRFDWKLTLLTAVLLPILLSLGTWQVRRADEKSQLQALYEARQHGAPTAIEQLSLNVDNTDLQYVNVSLLGSYVAQRDFLLDNRTYQGQVGFELLTPFVTTSGWLVLVNRGWVAMGSTREELPQVAAVAGMQELVGSIYIPVGKQLLLGTEQLQEAWPRVVQELLPEQLLRQAQPNTELRVFPYSVRLAEDQRGVQLRNWSIISTTPEKHYGYAVQWFAMAMALVLLYFYYSTRPSHADDADASQND